MIVIVWIWIFLGKITSPIYDKGEGKKKSCPSQVRAAGDGPSDDPHPKDSSRPLGFAKAASSN